MAATMEVGGSLPFPNAHQFAASSKDVEHSLPVPNVQEVSSQEVGDSVPVPVPDVEQSSSLEVGGSLPVPNVQELAAVSEDVSARYIRPERELEQVANGEFGQIPVIDMSKLVGDDKEESARLHSACKEWGFFQVINHGVADEVITKMTENIQEFFSLPLQEKMEYAQLPTGMEGYGQAFVFSEQQTLDWGDMLFINATPINERRMRFWPKNPASFRETLDKYAAELEKAARRLMVSMARNLGVEPEKLLSLFDDGVQSLRMNYYPPCEQASKVTGIAPHADGTGLTLLTRLNQAQGLQVMKEGKWVPIDPLPGAFIVNIGDMLEIITNGEYKSIEHRALVNDKNERLSIASFHDPSMNIMVEPLPDLLIKDQKKQAPNYKSISHRDYKKISRQMKLDGKDRGFITHMKIEA
ncbi:unnamed protein product [Linum trigynum]|uniref:Fe2OG dioxygenase domain-containing protein n=1 Tax=Linum trigynum TaxID=586398 RepID=A0AAV2G8M5_9ROSI